MMRAAVQSGLSASFAHGCEVSVAAGRNNYRGELLDRLESAFPTVRAWLGEQAFRYTAVKHIGRYAAHRWSADACADSFHLSLLRLFPHNSDLHELAWIESALNTALAAADAAPVTSTDLASVNWETARLRFTPSLQTTRCVSNAADIWRTMHGSVRRLDGEILNQARGLVVWRRGPVPCLHTVTLLELEALVHMRTCGNFSSLCMALAERYGESEGTAMAGGFLAGWISSELITGIDEGAMKKAS